MKAIDKVRQALGPNLDEQNDTRAKCPAHNGESSTSLSLSDGGDRVLMFCHAGCDQAAIVKALGLTFADLYDASVPGIAGKRVVNEYPYVSPSGSLVGVARRTDPKDFRPLTMVDGKWTNRSSDAMKSTPYRLPELLAAIDRGETVYVVEGEKDADTLASVGLTATTNAGGAGNWTPEHAAWLRGADVVIVRDRDPAGEKRGQAVGETLAAVGADFRIMESASGKDVTDHFAAGLSIEQLGDVTESFAHPDSDDPSSWAPVDLSDYVNGTHKAVTPTILARDDGVCLFYRGETSSLYGESESAKSMIAQLAAVTEIAKGYRVAYIDYESDPASVVGRLKALGADGADILSSVDYRNPDVPITDLDSMPDWLELLDTDYGLVIIDGVTEAFATAGVSSIDNDEVSRWMRAVPKTIARQTGAGVILIDHVTKSSDGRGRFAIGAQAKLSALTGVGYKVEPIKVPVMGGRGSIQLSVTKDRPGTVRRYADQSKNTADRSMSTAIVIIDSTDDPDRIHTEVIAWDSTTRAEIPEAADWRPTFLMERVSRTLEVNSGLSSNQVSEQTTGGKAKLLEALRFLIEDGYAETIDGKHHSKEPYRFNEREQGGTGSRFPSKEGEPEEPGTTYRPTGSPVQGTSFEPVGTSRNRVAICRVCKVNEPEPHQSRCRECAGEPPF